MLNIITDLIFLLLFARMVQSSATRFYFNPVLSAPHSLLDRIFAFLKPVFFSIPEKAVSGIILLFLIFFRGAIYAKTGIPELVIGTNCHFTFPPSWYAGPMASLLDFLVFLTRFWGLCFFISFLSSCTVRTRVHQALIEFGKPFTYFSKALSPLILIVANIILVGILLKFTDCTYTAAIRTNQGIATNGISITSAISSLTPLRTMTVVFILALLSSADLLLFTLNALLISIFASLIAIIFRNRNIATLFMEFQNVILGFFGTKPLRLGMFDFTPVIFFIALQAVYTILVKIAFPTILDLTGVLQNLPPVFP